RIFGLEKKKLRRYERGRDVVDVRRQENDALLEQPRIDVVRTLSPTGGLDDHGYQIHANLAIFMPSEWEGIGFTPGRQLCFPRLHAPAQWLKRTLSRPLSRAAYCGAARRSHAAASSDGEPLQPCGRPMQGANAGDFRAPPWSRRALRSSRSRPG